MLVHLASLCTTLLFMLILEEVDVRGKDTSSGNACKRFLSAFIHFAIYYYTWFPLTETNLIYLIWFKGCFQVPSIRCSLLSESP